MKSLFYFFKYNIRKEERKVYVDHELCHSTSKPIGDEESTLKSFMAFDIIARRPIFRVVVRSQIVVPSKMKICKTISQQYTLLQIGWGYVCLYITQFLS